MPPARLRAELADDQARQELADARAGRISAQLDADGRPDPDDPDARADVEHYYDVVLEPKLAELDPAQKAAAIGAYVGDTGMVPDAALDVLLGLSVTGKAEDRIAAARALIDIFATDPAIRDRVPPALVANAEILAQFATLETLPPEEVAATADSLLKASQPQAPGEKHLGQRTDPSRKPVQLAMLPAAAVLLPALSVSAETLSGLGTTALTTRRRSVDAPTAADVPTVDPAVARDPGLDVPDGAFGGGIGEGLETLGNTVSNVARAIERQRKLQDATGKHSARVDLIQRLREGLEDREKKEDFADDPVRLDYNRFVDAEEGAARQRIREADGGARLSDEAMARLDLDLDEIGQMFRDRGDTLHLLAVERRGIDQLDNFVDEAAGRARRFVGLAPGDEAFFTLGAELDLLDETVAGFDGAFRDDRERDIRAAGRLRIIEAAVTGLAGQGRGDEAKALPQRDAFAGDLDESTNTRLAYDIDLLSPAHDRIKKNDTSQNCSTIDRPPAAFRMDRRNDTDIDSY